MNIFKQNLEIMCIAAPTIYSLLGIHKEAIELAIQARILVDRLFKHEFQVLKLKLQFFLV